MRREGPAGRLTTDGFVEAFAAALVLRGRRHVRAGDADVRDGLLRVFEFLDGEVDRREGGEVRTRSLVRVRELFRPSPVGSFDGFVSAMRGKQAYLTEVSRDGVVVMLSRTSAASVLDSLDAGVRDLVGRAVDSYAGA